MEMRSASNQDVIELITELSTSSSSLPLQQGNSTQSQSCPLEASGLPGKSSRPNLIARWDIEYGKLVCRWIVSDRPRNSSTHC
jgi:hypothetical protein